MQTGRTRVLALDGLRGIAISMVLIYHAFFHQPHLGSFLLRISRLGGLTWSGVDLFFVLSGFLIGGILLDQKPAPYYYSTFYIRRAYRILPLYFALIVFYLAVRSLRFGSWMGFDLVRVPTWAFATFTQNIWMAIAGTFGAASLSPTWSLAVEEQFYLTLPMIVRKLSRHHLVALLIGVICIAPLLRTVFYFRGWQTALYVLMPLRADTLCWGVLIAVIARSNLDISKTLVRAVCGLLFVLIALMIYRGYTPDSKVMAIAGYSVLASFFGSCLLLAIDDGAHFLDNRVLRGLGTIAYGAYLLHGPLLGIFARFAPFPWSALLAIAATIIIASLSWVYFEKPLVRRGHYFSYGSSEI